MKRSITSLKNANRNLLNEISKLYPKGVDDSDLVSFPTTSGVNIRAIEIEVDDVLYLVKLDDESFYRKYLAKTDDDEDEDEEEDDVDNDELDDELDDVEDLDEEELEEEED